MPGLGGRRFAGGGRHRSNYLESLVVRDVIALLRAEPRSRLFYVALTQSALGNGAAYVALLLVAYDRWPSAWAISLVLLADLLPAMLLGPLFGAVADRWSRRWCLVAADVIRAIAFTAIALVDVFAATLVFALFAGAGTALFTPASLAALPSLVSKERVPAATSLYGAIADLGFTAGPGLAAGVLVLAGAEELLLANGITFAISAVILARLPFGARPEGVEHAPGRLVPSLFREAREGLSVVARMRGIRVIIAGGATALFFGGLFNVAELPFATDSLETSDAGYSVLVALFGLGFIAGSLAGSGGGSPELLRKRFVQGVFLMGAGFLLSGLAPGLVIALLTFTVAGFGNGLFLVHERIIMQETVPDGMMARAFGVKDALASWAFGSAFLMAGALLSVFSPRELIAGAGVGAILVAIACLVALRREGLPWRTGGWRRLGRRGGALRDLGADQQGPDVVGGRNPGPPLLDHRD
jgi:MFS family permease